MQENNNFEEKTLENKKRKKKGPIILIICLALVIVGLVTYILYDKKIILNKTNTTAEKVDKDKETNTKIETKNETEITSKDIKLSLSKKIDQITFAKDTNGNDYFSANSYAFNFDLLKNFTLTEEEKLFITLKSLENNYTSIMIESSKMDLPSEWEFWRNDEYKDGDRQLLLSYVKERYNNLFGLEEIQYNNTSNSKCPSFIYDKTNQVYYVIARCGGTSGISIISYKANYMEKDDEAYVDVYYGSSWYLGDESNKVNIYNKVSGEIPDLENQTPYKINHDLDEQIITEQNYQDFEKYKFTFKLNNNKEYNFVKVEKG